MNKSCNLLRLTIWMLGSIALIALVGGVLLTYLGQKAPPELWMVVIGISTGISHLLSVPNAPGTPPPNPVDVNVTNATDHPIPIEDKTAPVEDKKP